MGRIMAHHQEYGRYKVQNLKSSTRKLTKNLYHIQKKSVPAGVVMAEARFDVPVAVDGVMLTVLPVVVVLNLMANVVEGVAVEDSGAPHAVEMA